MSAHFNEYGRLAPGILNMKDSRAPTAEGKDLCLPLSFTGMEQTQLGLEALVKVEIQLRIGHCYDCLTKLREALGLKSLLLQSKRTHMRGYHLKTRSEMPTQRATDLVHRSARLYRRSWQAVASRCGEGPKSVLGTLQRLEEADLSTLEALVQDGRFNPGDEPISWIWRTVPHLGLGGGPDKDLAYASWIDESKPSDHLTENTE